MQELYGGAEAGDSTVEGRQVESSGLFVSDSHSCVISYINV